jgi:hypothetical protein
MKVIPSLAFASTVIPVTEALVIAPEVNTPEVVILFAMFLAIAPIIMITYKLVSLA